MESAITKCLECQDRLVGRSDKRFCSDACRSAYNNRLNKDESNFMKNVTRTLRKNRRILKNLNPSGKIKVRKEKLNRQGFNFNYFTSIYITGDGAMYRYCYEQGYLLLKNDYCLLVVDDYSQSR